MSEDNEEKFLNELSKDIKFLGKYLEDKKSTKSYALELMLNCFDLVLFNIDYDRGVDFSISKGLNEIIERWRNRSGK